MGNSMDGALRGWDSGMVAWLVEREAIDLEGRLARCAAAWHLRVGQPLGGGFRSHVRACTTSRGEEAVMKLTVTPIEAELEAGALEHWASTGAAVGLIDFDADNSALLLERLRPATPLPSGHDKDALQVVVDLLARLQG